MQVETAQELCLVKLLGILYSCWVVFLGRLPQASKVYYLVFYLVTPTLRAAVSALWALLVWMQLVYSAGWPETARWHAVSFSTQSRGLV